MYLLLKMYLQYFSMNFYSLLDPLHFPKFSPQPPVLPSLIHQSKHPFYDGNTVPTPALAYLVSLLRISQ